MTKEQIKSIIKKLNVLFVDDEQIVVTIMRDILPTLFNQSYFATNGHEAITLFKKNNIDVIITDISMPKLDGITMMNNILSLNKKVQTIFISGHNEKNILTQAKKISTNFIIKPINSKDLYSALENIVA